MPGVRLFALTAAALCALVVGPSVAPAAARPACANATLVPTNSNHAQIRTAILCLLNQERHRRHLARLHSNPTLGAAARSYARKLVRDQFFDHTSPDGTTMLDRILQTSYVKIAPRQWWVGENIGYETHGADTASRIVGAWMNSAGHRENILRPHYRDIGLGAASGTPIGRPGTTYVTDFGRRIR